MSEPTPLSAEERYPIEIIQGVEGFCIGLNNYRIAGPKPWGGGTVVKRWDVSLADLGRAIPSIDAQRVGIAALRAVSSQQQQRAQLAEERIAALRGALESIEDAWAKLVEPGWQKHVASLKGADAPEASHAWVKHIFTFQLAGFRARVLAGKEAQG